MADLLQRELGVKVELVEGDPGEFVVLIGDKVVATKGLIFFPPEKKVLAAVRKAMAGQNPSDQQPGNASPGI
jgi:hypothetical protein